ncbi:LysR family transcriptional regulator [Oscillospiraceae bacterium LTW-04]|nr:LysR family transcriptional regulator [Oscillospiraceae bacterium MB24-C1]
MFVNRNPEYFLTVARERNISRAAEKLFISQPSLSQHIAKLEQMLGTKLFDRSQNPLELTQGGQMYRSYLENSNHLYQKFQSGLDSLQSSRNQTVNLGLGTWRGSILLPQILPRFLQEHPNAQINLHEYPVSELYALLQNGKADFAVMNTSVSGSPEAFVTETINYERILLVLHRENPVAQSFIKMRAAGLPLDLKLLEPMRFISLNRTLTVGRHVSNFLEKNLLVFSDRLNTTNNHTALKLVSADMGFCFLVETGVKDASNYPGLVFFDTRSADLNIPLSFCYKINTYLVPLAQTLMNTIRAYYQDWKASDLIL